MDYLILEGKLQMGYQDNLVMNVYQSNVTKYAAAYNGGCMYIYDAKTCFDLEADNGKIFCENSRNDGKIITLRQGIGKNTEVICDCGYKVVNELRNEVRMGAFLNKISWLIRSE